MTANNPFESLLGLRTSLSIGTRQRLAILEPSVEQSAPIKLTLTDANVEETSYDCISYDRFGTHVTATVSIDGVDREVPGALEEALRTFRREETTRTIWADILVGRTIEERCSHLPEMRRALVHAGKTLCWLGPEKPLTARAFGIIRQMADRWTQACANAGISPEHLDTSGTLTAEQRGAFLEQVAKPSFDHENFFDMSWFDVESQVDGLFGSSYWTRPQCICETVLAEEAIVVCGQNTIPFVDYNHAFRAYVVRWEKLSEFGLLPHVSANKTIMLDIAKTTGMRRSGKTMELLTAVLMAQNCSTGDPKDVILSTTIMANLLGTLVDPIAGPLPLLAIDQSKTVQQNFTDIAGYIIRQQQNLWLWELRCLPPANRVNELPTWVPDFSVMRQKVWWRRETFLERWWTGYETRKPLRVSDDNILTIEAYPVDRIVHISPVFHAYNATRLCYEEFKNLPAPESPETLEEMHTRFWRTLVLNDGPPEWSTIRRTTFTRTEVAANFRTHIALETLLDTLGCTPPELINPSPELRARILERPELFQPLLDYPVLVGPFEQLLVSNSLGRCFFRTESGKFGMTAPYMTCDGPLLLRPIDLLQQPSSSVHPADVGTFLADPSYQSLIAGLHQYLAGMNRHVRRMWEQNLRGRHPGHHCRCGPGAAVDDVVFDCVGAKVPYILRPVSNTDSTDAISADDTGTSPASTGTVAAAPKDFKFIGDCYIHDNMNGDFFVVPSDEEGVRYYVIELDMISEINII
ncbi:hypothetical protein GGS20DRAFT_539164 [Poronia punctata]|nr:hypothetical protein GGS20DRAFT_539164 [Poronia punctata]